MNANAVLAQVFRTGLVRNYDPVDAVTTSVFAAADQVIWTRVREGGTLSAIRLYVTTQSGNLCCAVARNTGTGTSAAPGALIATTGAVATPVAGSQSIALTGGRVAVRTGDWIGIAVDNVIVSVRCKTTAAPTDSGFFGGFGYREAIASGTPAIPAARGTLTAQVNRGFVLTGN